jgi:FlaA1/EpsC-like NDP-sugar epimerase
MAFNRNGWILLLDTTIAGASFAGALWLRLGDAMLLQARAYLALGILISVCVSVPIFLHQRQPRAMWRYTSLRDLLGVMQSSFAIVAITYALLFVLVRLEDVPRSAPLIHALLLVAALTGPRVLYRAYREGHLGLQPDAPNHLRVPVLLLGTNTNAEQFVRETQRNPDAEYDVVGLVTSDAGRIGQRIHGIPVFGPPGALDRIIRRLDEKGARPEQLILTDPEISGARVQEWLDEASAIGIALHKLPNLMETQEATAKLSLKPVAIEDLLGRPQAALDHAAMADLVEGKHVLITGAGGTIGSELAMQVVAFRPAALTLLDSSEYALYQIEQAMLAHAPEEVPVYCMLGDVRDRLRMEQIFTFQKPEVVFHAAAIKHVPVAERDCEEAVLTNVFGTQHVAECCLQFGARAMVLISTDKAVEPSNIMGATKRLAERYFLWLNHHVMHTTNGGRAGTLFLAVRFGNVLGSTGSVVPLFNRQLAEGGPLTVTHPEMRRYFMTTREAVQLVLQAGAMLQDNPAQGRTGVFVLDMGDSVKIDDLARRMIQLAGLRYGDDISISYTGIRQGEKLEEALFYEDEIVTETNHPSIQMAQTPNLDLEDLAEGMVALYDACLNRDRETTYALLQQLVPEYIPLGWSSVAA